MLFVGIEVVLWLAQVRLFGKNIVGLTCQYLEQLGRFRPLMSCGSRVTAVQCSLLCLKRGSHPLKYRYTINPCGRYGGPHPGCDHTKPTKPSLNQGLPNVVAHNRGSGATAKVSKSKGGRASARNRNSPP
ncbi:unnamed protein product [Camellia sinensis]